MEVSEPEWPERLAAFVQGRIEAMAAWHAAEARRHAAEAKQWEAFAKWLARLWPHVKDLRLRLWSAGDDDPDQQCFQ